MTVVKIRQQVLNSSSPASAFKQQHQTTFRSTLTDLMHSSGTRGLFRGVGIVVALAIPARMLYISVLEVSRHAITVSFSGMDSRTHASVAAISGGVAGGLAAMSAQVLVVPMDVISQKQIVMPAKEYYSGNAGTVRAIIQSEVRQGTWRALYRGFGLSLFSSLPTGTIWWATYSGCQQWVDGHLPHFSENNHWVSGTARRGAIQLVSGLSAALVAASLTQPLDVVRTRLQVGLKQQGSRTAVLSPMSIASHLASTSGMRGFFRGLGPRTIHMGVWGTILSSAYEVLREISRIR